MIEYTTGDILRDDSEAIVNTVNCVGVMGRGIALQFKNHFPENFQAYAAACKNDQVQPGKMFVFETQDWTNPKYIINFPTKRHWRGKSRIEDIASGLVALTTDIRSIGIKSIAIPPLGAGLGGLEWPVVKSKMEELLSGLTDVRIRVYEPQGAPSVEMMVKHQEVPKMTPGRAALVELVDRYLNGMLDPFVTLLEVHKLMYFMQEIGEPLKLNYTKGVYGPYATNLGHVLKRLEGYLVAGYADGGDEPTKQLKLVPGAREEAKRFLLDKQDTRARFEKVSKLVSGFETPFGMELLATVHWVVKYEVRYGSIEEIVEKTHQWSDRKKQFSVRQIEVACKTIKEAGLVSVRVPM